MYPVLTDALLLRLVFGKSESPSLGSDLSFPDIVFRLPLKIWAIVWAVVQIQAFKGTWTISLAACMKQISVGVLTWPQHKTVKKNEATI